MENIQNQATYDLLNLQDDMDFIQFRPCRQVLTSSQTQNIKSVQRLKRCQSNNGKGQYVLKKQKATMKSHKIIKASMGLSIGVGTVLNSVSKQKTLLMVQKENHKIINQQQVTSMLTGLQQSNQVADESDKKVVLRKQIRMPNSNKENLKYALKRLVEIEQNETEGDCVNGGQRYGKRFRTLENDFRVGREKSLHGLRKNDRNQSLLKRTKYSEHTIASMRKIKPFEQQLKWKQNEFFSGSKQFMESPNLDICSAPKKISFDEESERIRLVIKRKIEKKLSEIQANLPKEERAIEKVRKICSKKALQMPSDENLRKASTSQLRQKASQSPPSMMTKTVRVKQKADSFFKVKSGKNNFQRQISYSRPQSRYQSRKLVNMLF